MRKKTISSFRMRANSFGSSPLRRMLFFLLIVVLAGAKGQMVSAEQLVILSLGEDRKIVVYSLDAEAGVLTQQHSIDVTGKPTAMCVDQDASQLYVSMAESNSLAAFEIADDGALTPLGETNIGAAACYVNVHPSGDFLLSAYYQAGQVTVHRIDDQGKLSAEPIQTITTDKHAHSIVLDPSSKFAFASHTSPNAIFQFRFDPETGQLSPNDPAKVQREPNSGPRHLWFHPNGEFAFGSDEQGRSVTTYQFDKTAGTLEKTQTVSSLPAEGFDGNSNASDIEVHPSGKFLYIANRFYDAIASYSIAESTGQLTLLGHVPTEPVTRSFNISPDGRFLVAGGQSSGKLAVFRINEDGSLQRTSTFDAGKNPWWVQIIER